MKAAEELERPVASLAELLRRRATESQSATALRTDAGAITYAELDARADRVAAALCASGLPAGARVGFLDRNSPICVELLFGVARAGMVLVPLNWRLSPSELAEIVTDAGISLLVAGREFLSLVAGHDGTDESQTLGDWLDGRGDAPPCLSPDPERVVVQIYTSGTTGRFKGVMLADAAMTAHLGELATVLGYNSSSVNLTATPMFHVAGICSVLLGLVHGGQTVLLRDVDLDVLARALPLYRITHAFLVPTVVAGLLDRQPAIDWTHLETVMYGASVISTPLLQRALREIGCSFIQVYGLTESRGSSTVLPPEAHDPDRPALLGSCGRPLPWVEIRVVDPETGEDVTPGRTGELWIRSPHNMAGYWNAPEATNEVIVDDGWLRTGDAGHVDDEGWYYIDDRLKDLIVSGGENIYPAEIERLLDGREDVASVAVIGIPHERWGETPAALIVPRDVGSPPSAEELIGFCRTHLAHYKCPTVIEFVAELPRNSIGKVLKGELRKHYWQGYDRRIN
ncbi:fatty acid--CoA ligase [Nocardioides immobilis]|uniref:Fatty acid--CoA ligase n=1 Tax=Nocardioides immobilis TaxID=2049295 RepID=A0A417Y6J3_9ACTN|nr:AMP-binding protein [Nocardioides immobilis]RHW28332.1 fatty acid--CoA ligase [Nocardioides immobilis]